ncbi:MAG: SIMPL domain-containing protein [Sphingomonadales bacterium]|nr:SIMPL domain-containing protein [Sphingomonadales bacterium]
MNFLKQHFSTVLIAVAVIVTGLILGKSYLSKGKPDDTVSVLGLGEESFDSDLIVWRASFSRRSYELKDAYAQLNSDIRKVRSYLKSRGINEDEMVFEAADISKEWSRVYDDEGNLRQTIFDGYSLNQSVKVSSKKVNVVEQTSRQVSELIDAGIELNSEAPEYYYTKLAQLKLKMIEAATKDARQRAEKIAENGGGSLGKLKNADMGVFQITAENSSEDYEWGGSFNTSSRRKTANVTIRLKYEID